MNLSNAKKMSEAKLGEASTLWSCNATEPSPNIHFNVRVGSRENPLGEFWKVNFLLILCEGLCAWMFFTTHLRIY